MIVCKFGGSATATKQALKNVLSLKSDDRNVWVFSAIGKSNLTDAKLTDLLIKYTSSKSNKTKIKKQIKQKLLMLKKYTNCKQNTNGFVDEICSVFDTNKNKFWFISRGEYITAKIMAEYLNIKFLPAEKIIFFRNNKLNLEKIEKNIKKHIIEYKNIVIPGFYGLNEHETNFALLHTEYNSTVDRIKLFSRGGSDFSASIIAKCLGANIYENWTDVDGIFETNPQIAKSNRIEKMSYTDLDIMSNFDAKVIHKDCAKLLNGTDTKLIVKNILTPQKSGTIVSTICQPCNYCVFKPVGNHTKAMIGLQNGNKISISIQKNSTNEILKLYKRLKLNSI